MTKIWLPDPPPDPALRDRLPYRPEDCPNAHGGDDGGWLLAFRPDGTCPCCGWKKEEDECVSES